jgi:hypothetical protein
MASPRLDAAFVGATGDANLMHIGAEAGLAQSGVAHAAHNGQFLTHAEAGALLQRCKSAVEGEDRLPACGEGRGEGACLQARLLRGSRRRALFIQACSSSSGL